MASREVVVDEYFAIALGISLQGVRMKRWRRNKRGDDSFPLSIDESARMKLTPRRAADKYIEAERDPEAPKIIPPAHLVIDLNKTVGLDYIARELRISLATARTYAADGPQHPEGFPTPVNTWAARAEPLYNRREADIFIAARRAGSAYNRGRLNANATTPTAITAENEASRLLGHEINLDNRVQVQEALFGDRGLPLTKSTSRGPSVSSADLLALFAQHPDPLLQQVLLHRGIATPGSGS